MGCVDSIRHDRFPKQGGYLNRAVLVVFHFDTEHTFAGVIVRDDVEPPFQEIIRLDDGRYVLTTECQWRPAP